MSDLEHNLRLLLEQWRKRAICLSKEDEFEDYEEGASYELNTCIEDIETLLPPDKPEPCDHNEMVRNDGPDYPLYAWKCAKCGYVYGKVAQS